MMNKKKPRNWGHIFNAFILIIVIPLMIIAIMLEVRYGYCCDRGGLPIAFLSFFCFFMFFVAMEAYKDVLGHSIFRLFADIAGVIWKLAEPKQENEIEQEGIE